METPAHAAAWFLTFAAPLSLWVAWTDLSSMRISNKAVMWLLLGFVLVAPFVLPWSDIGWRILQFAIVLVIGFLMNAMRMIGGGDAKFAAAMAPFVAAGDALKLLYAFAAILMAAFVVHRLARATPAIRNLVPNWACWTHKGFPMGFPLGTSLILYLLLAAFPQLHDAVFSSNM